jgi:UDPglucose--hexose-1-phosphate uridylyltransferase
VIISEIRTERPDQNHPEVDPKPGQCPFCAGGETMTPPEVYRIGEGGPTETGWKVRVVPNKYPITDFHEVIIHSPDDSLDLHHMKKEDLIHVFEAYKQRFNFYRDKGQVLLFCNRGEHAGASIKHPHSQLVVIPSQINLDTLRREPLNNIVEANTFFNIYCPDFSQWPYEVWLAPKIENTLFGDISAEEIEDLASIFTTIMNRLEALHETRSHTGLGFSYNFYIHPKENWYMRIIPRFIHRAGFELGTGLSVNQTDPRDAAKELRGREEELSRLMKKIEELKKI